ncbi:MAG TPA: hypothetical protein VEX13_02365 [Chloroflexia bacterium]|nr:hypothetical protein [Chloroflexia bacterium]
MSSLSGWLATNPHDGLLAAPRRSSSHLRLPDTSESHPFAAQRSEYTPF